MDSEAGTTRATGRRRQDLDLMRAAVVAGLLFFHSALVLDPPGTGTMRFVFFAKLWAMPLMFVVAGAGIWHSLHTRTAGGFVRERFSRLLIPLVVGIMLIVPPQVYYSLRADRQDLETYWQFLDRFFDVRLALDFPWIIRGADPDRLFDAAHLWFLYFLLIYSLLLLPAFLYLRRGSGRWLTHWLVAFCQKGWGVFVLALPVVVVEVALGTGGVGGWNSYAYMPFLVLGFLTSADRRLGDALRQNWKRALLFGMATLLALFVIAHYDLGGPGRTLGTDYDLWSVVWRLLRAAAGWVWVVAIFGFAASLVRRLPKRPTPLATGVGEPSALPAIGANLTSRVTRYVNDAVLPFYVVHETAIVIIGFYVVEWRIGLLSKYLTISFASLAATLLVYDIFIRRTNITRVLFGMRPMPARSSTGTVVGEVLGVRRNAP